jgi:hypothetical protein
MPWKCPACQTPIRSGQELPQLGVVYRCATCRLELVADPSTNKLVLAPLPPDPEPDLMGR